ncbi:MAG: PorV/PorQ family protein [FCB group bacterium]|nr:PorV/PorQ family protein [FCB group bacterium]
MKKIFFIGILGLGIISAQTTTKVATTSGQFLKIGAGARAAGMAESFSAVANDITAIYWNPAGLSHTSGSQIYFSHIEWLAGISYDFFAAGAQVGRSGAAGVFATSVQVPDDEVRTVLQPEGTGEFFSASDLAIGGAYAQRITDRFSVGAVGKLVQERIWSMTSMSIAFDLGILYRSNWHNLTLGVVLNNYGTKTKLSGRANLLYVDPDPTIEGNIETIRAELEMARWNLPLNLKTSMSLKVLDMDKLSWLVAVDMVHPSDNNEYFDLGTEISLNQMLALRGGYRGLGLDAQEGGLAFGGGLRITLSSGLKLQVDYALTDWGRLKNVSQLSFGVGF